MTHNPRSKAYSEWIKSVSASDLPNHLLRAWRQNWKSWVLVDTKQHERLYDGYMKSHTLEKNIRKLEARLNRKLTLRERLIGRIVP